MKTPTAHELQEWLEDCDIATDGWSYADMVHAVNRLYQGGLRQFIRDGEDSDYHYDPEECVWINVNDHGDVTVLESRAGRPGPVLWAIV